MNRPDQYDVYADEKWDVLGGYPMAVRPATRWARFVARLRRVTRR